MDLLISVIVPIYNVEAYLDQCIRSIVEQTYNKLEIILVDDGSPDKCPEICDEWALKDKRVKVIHKKNGGLSDARNAGLDVAKGDLIAFVDSDDWIEPKMYQTMLNALIKEDADICACGTIDSFETFEKYRTYPYYVGGSEETLAMIYKETIFPVSAWNKLHWKKNWENLRFPVGKICEDAFTTYLLVDRADKIVQIPEPLYHYRIRENSIMTSKFNLSRMDEEEAWRCNYEFVKKRYPNIQGYAFDFYLQKVYMLIHLIEKSEKKEFSIQYQYLKKILKNNFFYIMFKSKLSIKFRLKFAIGYFKL